MRYHALDIYASMPALYSSAKGAIKSLTKALAYSTLITVFNSSASLNIFNVDSLTGERFFSFSNFPFLNTTCGLILRTTDTLRYIMIQVTLQFEGGECGIGSRLMFLVDGGVCHRKQPCSICFCHIPKCCQTD